MLVELEYPFYMNLLTLKFGPHIINIRIIVQKKIHDK